MSSIEWAMPTFGADVDSQAYFKQIEQFLANHPPGSLGDIVSSVTPPSSDSSSPTSSDERDRNSSFSTHSSPAETNDSNDKSDTVEKTAGDKRKADDTPPSAGVSLKDRRESGTGGEAKEATHSHNVDNDNDSGKESQDHSPEDRGRGGRGKTSERRKEQNRNAQRAFRERKEKHLKILEDQVHELEQKNDEKASENTNLKDLVSHLQKENERLKVFEAAFTFNFNKDVSSSSAMPLAPQFTNPHLPPLATTSRASPMSFIPTPLNMNDLSLSRAETGASKTSTMSPSDSSLSLLASLGIPPGEISGPFSVWGNPSSDSPISTSASPHASGSDSRSSSMNDPFLGVGTSSNSTPSTATIPTPPSSTKELNPFSTWRESSADLASFSSLSQSDIDDLFNSDPIFSGLDFSKSPDSQLPPSMTALRSASTDSASAASILGPETTFMNDVEACPLRQQTKHLGGTAAGFTFDLDGLCSEMKSKATCEEVAKRALAEALKDDLHMSQMFSGNSK